MGGADGAVVGKGNIDGLVVDLDVIAITAGHLKMAVGAGVG